MAKKRKKPAFTFYPASPVRRRYSKDRRWLMIGNRYDMIRYRCDRHGVPILARLLDRWMIKTWYGGSRKKMNDEMRRVKEKLGLIDKKKKHAR